MNEFIPLEITTAVAKFLAEDRTGNITLNIKDGKILGAHINEIITIKPAARPIAFNGEQHEGEKIEHKRRPDGSTTNGSIREAKTRGH